MTQGTSLDVRYRVSRYVTNARLNTVVGRPQADGSRGLRNASGLVFELEDGAFKVPPRVSALETTAKRVLDVCLSAFALVSLFPTLLAIALLIKMTSPGPVLLRQVREGLNGRPFILYKFRTMYHHVCDPSGLAQTRPGDERVTPIGRRLRAKSLDELPQLFNVFTGDMALVGPRPHVEGALAAGERYEDLVPCYRDRLMVRPGLSGWAQAQGLRGDTSDPKLAKQRIDHDLAYIANFSLWLDLKIIWLTIVREVIAGNAD